MLSLQKNNFSISSLFERGGGNSLKRTHVEGDICKTKRDEQGDRGQKLEISSKHTFLTPFEP